MHDPPPSAPLGLGDPLPRPDAAIVDSAKLHEYALNPSHPVGRFKARVFAAVLDVERGDWSYLREEILRALPAGRISTVKPGRHRATYGVLLPVVGLNGRLAAVHTAWVIEEGAPRLVSLRVDRSSLDE